MANNYTQFSEFISYKTVEEQKYLTDWLEAQHEEDEGPCCDFLDEPDFNRVWIYAEEWGDIDRLIDFVAEFQQRFSIKEPWSLEWANSCTKPMVGEFSGGGVLVMEGEIDWFTPSVQIEKRKREKGWLA